MSGARTRTQRRETNDHPPLRPHTTPVTASILDKLIAIAAGKLEMGKHDDFILLMVALTPIRAKVSWHDSDLLD